MTAAELRAIAKRIGNLEPYSSAEVTNDLATVEKDYECVAQAADVLELIAWAEENRVDVQRGQFFWWSRNVEDGQGGDKTLIELLRRAKEASKA